MDFNEILQLLFNCSEYRIFFAIICSVPRKEFHLYSNQIMSFYNDKYHFLDSFQLIYFKKYVFTNNKSTDIGVVMRFNQTWNSNSNSNNILFCSGIGISWG